DRLFHSLLENMTKTPKPVGVNYYKCIERLFQNDVMVDVSQDTLTLCREIGDLEAIRLISRAEPLQWTEVVRVLRTSDSKKLENELHKVGNRLELLLRPVGAPDGLTILHAAF
ncbi:hypothetical protein FHG87_011931, partial [Trinorchestia longiramus]